MSLLVGQRVKKVIGDHVGITGTVRGFDTNEPPWDVVIELDFLVCNGIGEVIVPGERADCFQNDWEPILPSGHQPAELTAEELLPFLKQQVTA